MGTSNDFKVEFQPHMSVYFQPYVSVGPPCNLVMNVRLWC